jgi:hypothetical protein
MILALKIFLEVHILLTTSNLKRQMEKENIGYYSCDLCWGQESFSQFYHFLMLSFLCLSMASPSNIISFSASPEPRKQFHGSRNPFCRLSHTVCSRCSKEIFLCQRRASLVGTKDKARIKGKRKPIVC